MQLEFLFHPNRQRPPPSAFSTANGQASANPIPLSFVRHRRARRYILRLLSDGTARVTLPRWGTLRDATEFARANSAWLQRQLIKQASRPKPDSRWLPGTRIYFRGQQLSIELRGTELRLGDHALLLPPSSASGDLRPFLEKHLWRLAATELPARVDELARSNGLTVRRVCVRNQRSRWGSCSRRGTVSLNWRLVQAPDFVRDYIILHELAHMKHLNHSRRFWAEVARLCPGFAAAERWLKEHSKLLR